MSAPVRAVVLPAMVELELELVVGGGVVLVFVFWSVLDCAEAIPASDSVMTIPRTSPASMRRAIDPVIRTLSLSQNASVTRTEFVANAPNSC
jgi:hypothetical protein